MYECIEGAAQHDTAVESHFDVMVVLHNIYV